MSDTTKETEAQAVPVSETAAEAQAATSVDTPATDSIETASNTETVDAKNEDATPAATEAATTEASQEETKNKYGYLPMLKTTTHIDPNNPNANYKKFDPSVLPPSDDPRLIRRQVRRTHTPILCSGIFTNIT